mgnify:CR=1 FL=1
MCQMRWWIKHWMTGMTGSLSRFWVVFKNPWCWDLLHIQKRTNQYNLFCLHYLLQPNEFEIFFISPNYSHPYGRLYLIERATNYCLALYYDGKNSSFGSDLLFSRQGTRYCEIYKTLPRYYQVMLYKKALLPILKKKL